MRHEFSLAKITLRSLVLVAATVLLPSVVLSQTWTARLIGIDAVPPTNSPATGMAILSLTDSVVSVRMSWGGLQSFPGSMCIFDRTPAGPADSDHLAFCLGDPIAPSPAQQGSYQYRENLYGAHTYSRKYLAQHNKSVPQAAAATIDALRSGRAYVAIFTQNFAPTIEIGGTLVKSEQ